MRHRTTASFYGGTVPLPVYTKPAACGGDCLFCPSVPGLPRSYVPNEDTLAARSLDYSPSHQFRRFLRESCERAPLTGIPLETIILGGSFSSLEHEYRRSFLQDLYNAMAFSKCGFSDQAPWETSPFRCSVLTVESRPDQITREECQSLRLLGVSKVEIGVQHLRDTVLEFNNRGHDQGHTIKATQLLKSEGFKVGYHVMLGLPGSTVDDDIAMVSDLLWSESYCPDYLKVYPCVLLKPRRYQPELHRLYEENQWRPMSPDHLLYVLETLRENVPPYVRISRIQRQFAIALIQDGPSRTLRNRLTTPCQCIRCREVGRVRPSATLTELGDIRLVVSHRGRDTFYELNADSNVLLGLCRIYHKAADVSIVREIRIYGEACQIGRRGNIQGRGLGKYLLKTVEDLETERGRSVLLVNAAIGARTFFRSQGYAIAESGFLVKHLQSKQATQMCCMRGMLQ